MVGEGSFLTTTLPMLSVYRLIDMCHSHRNIILIYISLITREIIPQFSFYLHSLIMKDDKHFFYMRAGRQYVFFQEVSLSHS